MRAFGCALCVLVLTGVAAEPARAAFPGRDGLLAVQPYQGPGLLLVNDRGGDQRRVCTDSATCGLFPRNPQWSPDGRELAFNASGVRVIYPDGSCLDCELARGTAAAFTADPQLLTVVSDGSLLEDSVDGVTRSTILAPSGFGAAPWSGAVWSARGDLAAVRRGRLWVGTPPHLRALGAGDATSWSPDGARLAIDRRGWVLLLTVKTGRARRLVRGEHPAWSPDGRWVAFIGAHHRLEIVSASGGRPHRVGRVRADGVDWQRRPAGPAPACAPPPGSRILASSADALVTADVGAVMGCLPADGRERLLQRVGSSFSEDEAATASVGAGYAAVGDQSSDRYGNASVAVAVFDLHTGARVRDRGGEGITCRASTYFCADMVNQVVVGDGGVSAAQLSSIIPAGQGAAPPRDVTCPAPVLCVALGFADVLTSTDPASGAWTATALPVVPAGLSCPSASLCVGVGGEYAFSSTDPTGGSSAWTAVHVDPSASFTSISCPSAALCVATDTAGDVWTSTDPTAGAGAWTSAAVDPRPDFGTMSCASISLCVAFDGGGDAVASTDPTGGAAAWEAQPVTAGPAVEFVSASCPSPSFCIALDSAGQAWTSSAPAGASWRSATLPGAPRSVACPAPSMCLAVGGQGTLDVSTDPSAGAWTATVIDDAQGLDSIGCASSALCVASDDVGDLVASTDPTGGAAAWTAALVVAGACSAPTDCTTEIIQAADSTGVHTLDAVASALPAPPLLTTLNLSGTLLTWDHAGQPESAVLQP